MIQLQDPREIRLRGTTQQLVSSVSEAADRLVQLRPLSQEVADRIRNALLPDRITASLNMEGIVATRRQTLAVMDALRVNESVGRGEREIANALRADEFVFDAVEQGLSLSEQLIREINRKILTDLVDGPGEYRKVSVELPGAPFNPPLGVEVPRLMATLVELFPLSEAVHPVLQAAWLHAQFTQIHPFVDGNGRTGRMLQDFALLRRGLLPIGIPPAQRDDYYSALEQADSGKWDELVEMLADLELQMIVKTEAIAREPEQRTAWIQRLSTAAAQKEENTRHKHYLVWRQRTERLSASFGQAARELDASSYVIGASFKDFGAVSFEDWQRICRYGSIDRSWLFSTLFFAEGRPFYKAIAYQRRHRRLPADFQSSFSDAVGIYFTGAGIEPDDRPDFQDYQDPHIRLRELLFLGDDLLVYQQPSPDQEWNIVDNVSIEDVVESFFSDVFIRKAGLAT